MYALNPNQRVSDIKRSCKKIETSKIVFVILHVALSKCDIFAGSGRCEGMY